MSTSKIITIYEQVGEKQYLKKVAKRFYDKVYAHPWLKLYFKNTRQEVIENQQVDFMTGALGGPKVYSGRMPADAHTHILITQELIDLRESLLIEALKEENAPPELIDRWLKVEQAFKRHLLKLNIDVCQKRWTTDEILAFDNPIDEQKKKQAS